MTTIIRWALGAALAAGFAGAAAGDLIYFEENGGAGMPRGFYTFDPATGTSQLRTTVPGTERFFGLETRPSTGITYATDPLQNRLYTIDVDTGQFELVGLVASDTIADITFDPTTDTLYGMGRNSPYRLYTIDPATGMSTLLFNTNASVRCGLVSSPSGTLYAFSIDGILSTLDPATGSTTLVGGSSVGGGVVEDSVYASDGNIYFTMFDGRLFRADPATGANVLVGNSGMGSGLLGIVEEPEAACYADCDGNGTLNIDDFLCFQLAFALQDPYADCDGNSLFNIDDFLCFQLAFALGC